VTQPVRRTFPGTHDQVARARAFVREIIQGCPLADDVILLTSELCTNTLQHSQSGNGGTFEVTVYHGPDSLRIEVRDDGSASIPARRVLESFTENGRGLEIVACLAHRWGQRGDEHGRTVYFEFRWHHHEPPSSRREPDRPHSSESPT